MQENTLLIAKLQKIIAIFLFLFVIPTMNPKAKSVKKRKCGIELWLLLAISVCLLMAVGPGVLLVNRPETFLGLPLVYGWALFWYLVIAWIAWQMDRAVWRKDALIGEDSDGSL